MVTISYWVQWCGWYWTQIIKYVTVKRIISNQNWNLLFFKKSLVLSLILFTKTYIAHQGISNYESITPLYSDGMLIQGSGNVKQVVKQNLATSPNFSWADPFITFCNLLTYIPLQHVLFHILIFNFDDIL